jgi:hypothetical protein
VPYHFIKKKDITKKINLIHVNIENQVANIFPKVLGTYKIRKFRKMFSVLKVDLNLRGNVENSRSIN